MLLWTDLPVPGVSTASRAGLFGVVTGGSTILRGPGGMLRGQQRLRARPGDERAPAVLPGPFGGELLAAAGITDVGVFLTHPDDPADPLARCASWSLTAVTMVIMAWRSGKLLQAIGVLDLGDLGSSSCSRQTTCSSGSRRSFEPSRRRLVGQCAVPGSWGVGDAHDPGPVPGPRAWGMRNFQYYFALVQDDYVPAPDVRVRRAQLVPADLGRGWDTWRSSSI